MPRLACWSCGRQVYATSPLESLFVDERRCPRGDRTRQGNPAHDPGPPAAGGERRTADRRRGPRRRAG
ncbi:MAG: hypothetical protein MUE92_07050 [Chloroflexi bacterium]|nr:hypothetical protein [Chloroflexota bacterium]